MKPFLGIDATVNKQNIEFDGSELLVSAPSGTASDTLETTMDAQSEMTETAKLPKPARVVQFVCGIAGALIAAGIFKAMSSENAPGFRQLYTNVPWLVWLGGICIALWAVLTVLGYKKMKTVADSEENQYVQSKTEATANQIYAELSVPQDAPTVDVLSFRYKMKKGELKVCALGLEGAPYTSFEFRIFADGQNLYLANLDGKYRFPLSSLRKIHTVRKRTRLPTGIRKRRIIKANTRRIRWRRTATAQCL